MTEQFETGLFEILRREIGERPSLEVADVLSDDEFIWAALVEITFPAYDTDEGTVTPKPITIEFQFNKDDGSYSLITGEDTENEVTAAKIFAYAYFYGLQADLEVSPIDLILHCPECHVQHIDAAEIPLYGHNRIVPGTDWTNPPHRSHLCHNCGTIWRPGADWTGELIPPALPQGLHPTVIAFAKAMQRKLDKNKHKDGIGWERNPDGSRNGWAGCSVLFLRQKLEEEVSELIDALEHEGPDEIRNEAADVGNIAMMLADVRGAFADTKEQAS